MSTTRCAAIRLTGLRIRTDLSVTLFLSEPDEYDGGELIVEDHYGSHEVKLPAGHLVLYPASSLHMVTPITRGHAGGVVLLAAKHDPRRPRAQPDLRSRHRNSGACQRSGGMTPKRSNSTGIYHNLIRYWAEV